MSNVEILAPAGSLDGLYASFQMGADAVYVGTSRFGARAFAKNPSVDELKEALVYAHMHDKKIYLTVNTLLSDRELENDLFPLIAPLYEAGLDACIVQDLGVLSFLHENFPQMDLHASTQMTILSGDEAELYKNYGVTRFVPARECTIEEIRAMRAQTDLEIEVFVHGALCYCYSGQCLMSEEIGDRSGNRGMCAQPCRLPFTSAYGNGHLFSTKDMCTLMHIPELVDAGIDSFKIEGRMKKKEYSAYLSSLYRHYVDVYESEGKETFQALVQNKESRLWKDIRRSKDIYNRGGFCAGYLFETDKKNIMYPKKNGHFGTCVGTVLKASKGQAVFRVKEALHYQDILEFRLEDDTKAYEYTVKNEAAPGDIVTCNVKRGSTIFKGQKVYRTKNAALLSWIDEKIESVDDKISLKGEMTAKIGKPIALKLQGLSHEVTVFGEPLQRAVNRPVTKDEIEKRLRKMGNTNYKLTDFSIILDDDSFVPMGEIAKLKREALVAFEREAVSGRSVEEQKPHKKKELPVWQNASILKVSTMEQLRTALRTDENDVWIELPVALFAKEEDEVIKLLQNRPVLLSFPRIMKAGAEEKWRSLVNRLFVGAVVINSHRALLVAKKRFKDCPWIAAETFYHENERAKEVLAEFGICQAIKRGYGRKEVMVTKGCLKRTLDRCDGKKERILVSGGKGDKFYVVNNCDFCYNTIYTKNGEKKPELDKPAWHHFTWETADEMRKVLKTWNLL